MINNGVQEATMERLLAAGGVLGAFAVSSCCAVPLALVAAGVSGAWIGTFAQLAPYQPFFLAAAALCVGLGFWRVYGRAQVACERAECGPRGLRSTKTALWFGLALLLVAGSAEWWARLLA
jgi:mercuric ion transport protein